MGKRFEVTVIYEDNPDFTRIYPPMPFEDLPYIFERQWAKMAKKGDILSHTKRAAMNETVTVECVED